MTVLWSPQNQAKVTHITLALLLPTANMGERQKRDAGVKGKRDKTATEHRFEAELGLVN